MSGTGNGNNVPDDCVHLKNAPWDDGNVDERGGQFSGKAILHLGEWGLSFVEYNYSGMFTTDYFDGDTHDFNEPTITRVFSLCVPKVTKEEFDLILKGGPIRVTEEREIVVPPDCDFFEYLIEMVKEHQLDHVLSNGWDDGPNLDEDYDPEAM